MSDVLFLTSADCDLQTRICVESLRSALGNRAEHLQANTHSWAGALGRLASIRRASRNTRVVHAWGYGALKLASFSTSLPLIYTPLAADPPQVTRWLLALRSRRVVSIVCHSVGDDRFLVSRSVPPEICQVVRPGVRMRKDLSRDLALRKQLGLGDDHIAVLAVGESDSCSDHALALHAVAILHEMDHRYVLVISGQGASVPSLLQLHANWRSNALVNAASLAPDASDEQIIAACDLGLITAPSRTPLLPILMCMAGNLPLVAPATPEISDVLEDRHSALLYSPLNARTVAHRIVVAAEDMPLCRKLADNARAEAYKLFPLSSYVSQMQEIYRQVADSQPSGK